MFVLVSIGRKNVQVNWGEPFTNELRRFKGAVVDGFFVFVFSARKTNAYENAWSAWIQSVYNQWPSVRLNDCIYCFLSILRGSERFLSSGSQLVSQLTAYLPADSLSLALVPVFHLTACLPAGGLSPR